MSDDEQKDESAGEQSSDSDDSAREGWIRFFIGGVEDEIAYWLRMAGLGALIVAAMTIEYEESILLTVLCFLAAIGLWVLAYKCRSPGD